MLVRETNLHRHAPEERADLFSVWAEPHCGGATEVEYLELLTALVRVQKPERVLETGTGMGAGTVAIAEGLRKNGFGKVVTIDAVPDFQEATRNWLEQLHLADHVEFFRGRPAVERLSQSKDRFDLAFFDSHLPFLCRECEICMDTRQLESGALAVFHDTSRRRLEPSGNGNIDQGREFWREFERIRDRFSDVFEFPLSRGLLVCKVR